MCVEEKRSEGLWPRLDISLAAGHGRAAHDQAGAKIDADIVRIGHGRWKHKRDMKGMTRLPCLSPTERVKHLQASCLYTVVEYHGTWLVCHWPLSHPTVGRKWKYSGHRTAVRSLYWTSFSTRSAPPTSA